MIRRGLLVACTLLLATVAPGAPLPGESIYQLPIELMLQDGSRTALAALRGRPTVITLFYASCDGVCPTIALTMRRMEATLDVAQQRRMQWVMVSFDPVRDTPEALRRFAAMNRLDSSRWRLARSSESGVRDLAAALGIRYRKLPNGAFSHSTQFSLLNADGVIVARTSSLGRLDAEFMRALAHEAQGPDQERSEHHDP